MAKPKQKQLLKMPGTKNSSATGTDMECPSGEDDWVMVMKQKVTIWIPPLPVTEQHLIPESEDNQQQPRPQKTTINQPQPVNVDSQVHSDSEMEKSVPSITEKAIPIPSDPRLPLDQRVKNNNIKRRKIVGVCDHPKIKKPFRRYLICENSLSKGLRARNVERKIQRAGGLSRWLVSMGLEQFVNIFQSKSVGKFQLANLSMKKLKDMGADAVGPRRKLMHAIDCLCQPYCFEAI